MDGILAVNFIWMCSCDLDIEDLHYVIFHIGFISNVIIRICAYKMFQLDDKKWHNWRDQAI